MIFNKYVEIDAHFQNSINIGLDFKDVNKINSYIPTSTGVNFLNHFISNVLNRDGDNSSMIIAPYGKGKSHAVLVLLSLLYENDYKQYEKLLTKIQGLDASLYEKLNQVKNKKYLPVVISNTRGTLNQSLFASLQRALEVAGITDIALNTEYHSVLDRIKEWKTNYKDTYVNFCAKLKEKRIGYNDFVSKIKSYDDEALDVFKDIHRNILSGAEFVSQSNLEVIDYYQEITNKLISNYGYDGTYVVFDEFTKFLESRDESTITNDMKIVQDLAEVCNVSKNHEIFLQLILHKPISESLSLDKRIRNAFKGIEGRVSTYYFTTSLKSSYDLISNVLIKQINYKELDNDEINNYIRSDISKLPLFSSEFGRDFVDNELVEYCYPLHPMTVYLLVKANEKVAQNERTLFTFLAKKSSNSLMDVMSSNYDKPYILPETVFDYFENLFLEEKDDIAIQKIATKAISAINQVQSEEEIALIKTLALLLIVNEKAVVPSNVSVIAAAMMISLSKCKELVEGLISKGILVQRHGGLIEFKINMDLNLESRVNDIALKLKAKKNIENNLIEISNTKYIYPRIYNINNSITRFYKVVYLREQDYLSLNTTEPFFEETVCDGIIINIIRGEINNYDLIINHMTMINDNRAVVIYPKEYSDYNADLRQLMAIDSLLSDNAFINDNPLVRAELQIMRDDCRRLLMDMIERDYSLNSSSNYICSTYNNQELNEKKLLLSKQRILGNIFEGVYPKYPNDFNLELINKTNVRGTYKKARESVVNQILSKTIKIEDLGTSPEDTIINCLLISNGILTNNTSEKLGEVISLIDQFLNKESGCFAEIYDKLTKAPYGLRKGVMPLLIANSINKLDRSILLSFSGKEMALNGATIEKINDSPKDFVFNVDADSVAKRDYLKHMANLFNYEITDDISKNYNDLSDAIRAWYYGLPKFTKQMIGKTDNLNDRNYKMLRKCFDQMNINPSEFMLETMLKVTNSECFEDAASIFEDMKTELDVFINDYKGILKQDINNLLGFERDSVLSHSVNYWIDNNQKGLDSRILENHIKEFIRISRDGKNGSENDLVNKIAYCFTSLFVEDWSDQTYPLFINELSKLKIFEEVVEDDNSESKIALEINGKRIVKDIRKELDDSMELAETFIESTLEDFGDVITNEQKVALLLKIIKKYI